MKERVFSKKRILVELDILTPYAIVVIEGLGLWWSGKPKFKSQLHCLLRNIGQVTLYLFMFLFLTYEMWEIIYSDLKN